MKPPVLRLRRDNTKHAGQNHNRGINRALLAKMIHAFERSVDQIDRKKQAEQQKDLMVVIKKINLPIGNRLCFVPSRK